MLYFLNGCKSIIFKHCLGTISTSLLFDTLLLGQLIIICFSVFSVEFKTLKTGTLEY